MKKKEPGLLYANLRKAKALFTSSNNEFYVDVKLVLYDVYIYVPCSQLKEMNSGTESETKNIARMLSIRQCHRTNAMAFNDNSSRIRAAFETRMPNTIHFKKMEIMNIFAYGDR